MSVDKLDSVFNQSVVPLSYTPRRQILDPHSHNFIIIESDNNTLSPFEKETRFAANQVSQMDTSENENGVAAEGVELPAENFGLPIAGPGNWASLIRIVNPFEGSTVDIHHLTDNEAAFRYAVRDLFS